MPNNPYEQDVACELCGKDPYDCACPECPTCGVVGDPSCAAAHIGGMARCCGNDEFQIGIYNVFRNERNRWAAVATGPGTVGDGSPREFSTYREAYIAITGEPPEYSSNQ